MEYLIATFEVEGALFKCSYKYSPGRATRYLDPPEPPTIVITRIEVLTPGDTWVDLTDVFHTTRGLGYFIDRIAELH